MKSITLIGRRWFRKNTGTTSHSVQVLIDGEPVWKSGRTNGYGDHYVDTAIQWLEANNIITDLKHHENGSYEPLWSYAERKGIKLHYSCIDVARKGDL